MDTFLRIFDSGKFLDEITRDIKSNTNHAWTAYPDLLTVGQLRAAYSIVIRSLSETDDALAWVCLEKLIKAIENLPTTDNIYSDTNSNIIHSINNILKKNNSSSNNNLQPTNSPFINQLIKSNNEKFIIESAALLFHRGHLLLTLIDQIKSVNLIFLKTLLLKIKNFLTNEPNSISKNAIQKVLFDALSTDLDYTKKEAGVKWWLTEEVSVTHELDFIDTPSLLFLVPRIQMLLLNRIPHPLKSNIEYN
ncbi:8799_t:CDS:2 [Entrophospora sp. SA101]|nr:8799_t:CDS:2 [Entrophospora sp. SA101]